MRSNGTLGDAFLMGIFTVNYHLKCYDTRRCKQICITDLRSKVKSVSFNVFLVKKKLVSIGEIYLPLIGRRNLVILKKPLLVINEVKIVQIEIVQSIENYMFLRSVYIRTFE